MRKFILIILLILFSAIYYYSKSKEEGSFINSSVSKLRSLINNSTTAATGKANKSSAAISEDKTSAVNSAAPNSGSGSSLQELSSAELQKWIATESRSMNSTKNETDEQQIRLRAQAQTLISGQLSILKELAVNPALPINERILSAYMISLNPSMQSQEVLFNVAKTEIIELGPLLPHSEAELKHTQELAIRYMQIDELFERAKTDANARDKLQLLVLEAQSAQVRSYAEKRLKELK